VLVHQIEAGRMHRQGKAVANFERTLPAPQSDLARDITKDSPPWNVGLAGRMLLTFVMA
jgi:hypothetical protein